MNIVLKPVAWVRNSRKEKRDDYWGSVVSEIELAEGLPDSAFSGIEAFSHLEVIYHFDRLDPAELVLSGHPRGNPAYPEVGIFAQRKKDRPNGIGLCTVELVERKGRTLVVRLLDAIDGTPVLDIKPVFKEFQAKGEIRQPEWVGDLMGKYWEK
ncbi:MAG: tRNA (N6-threonylcarbamoyladenosine(37)-N6)-methyltransferase TrmO [Bacteroidetes bacterium]|nr:tRNA (N6-threonylcarbamoyladenosine(37)-N6)-methyltransferase TrmO [Bacteroidota bacterium]